ncbi:MAG: hypothetical protein KGI19_11140, partial [Thaumarchaeota archaeon]|nr:hypothetical protein [Nitrososphaerota archaeon]
MKTLHFTAIGGIGIVVTGVFFIMPVIIGNSFNAYAACAVLPNGIKTCEMGLPPPSPLQQFKSGILAKDVSCTQEFQLILKLEDGSPACVTPDTAQKLMERGWAKKGHMGGVSAFAHPPVGISNLTLSTKPI